MMGGYKLIYPCHGDEERLEKYQKMIDISKELYEYFHNGKRNKDGNNLRLLRE